MLFHTGHSGIGTGMPGGGGIRLKYGHPMPIDDVAVDFPDMPIILAHPSFPWQDEAISVCLHKPQVYIDLSGWSPKYFSPTLVQYANTLLKHKVLFGSDYPLLTPDRWLADFEKIAIRDEVRPLILKENAVGCLVGVGPPWIGAAGLAAGLSAARFVPARSRGCRRAPARGKWRRGCCSLASASSDRTRVPLRAPGRSPAGTRGAPAAPRATLVSARHAPAVVTQPKSRS